MPGDAERVRRPVCIQLHQPRGAGSGSEVGVRVSGQALSLGAASLNGFDGEVVLAHGARQPRRNLKAQRGREDQIPARGTGVLGHRQHRGDDIRPVVPAAHDVAEIEREDELAVGERGVGAADLAAEADDRRVRRPAQATRQSDVHPPLVGRRGAQGAADRVHEHAFRFLHDGRRQVLPIRPGGKARQRLSHTVHLARSFRYSPITTRLLPLVANLATRSSFSWTPSPGPPGACM